MAVSAGAWEGECGATLGAVLAVVVSADVVRVERSDDGERLDSAPA